MPETMSKIDEEISKLEKLKMDLLKSHKEGGNMKIAVSATAKGLESQVDNRFGRCPFFVIVEIEDGKIKGHEDVENTATAQMGGAGITSSQLVAEKGIKAVITVNMGPRAFQIFSQLGIEIYQGSGTVREVVGKFIKKELKRMDDANGPMHMNLPGQ